MLLVALATASKFYLTPHHGSQLIASSFLSAN
jgi:hypothetical protein